MKVAYDARSLHPRWRNWGVGVVVSNIVKHLEDKVHLIGLAPRSANGAPESLHYWPSPTRKLDLLTFEASPLLAGGYDLYWGTNHLLPQLAQRPTLLTVHDLLLFKFPDDQPWARYSRARFKSSMKRADRIVAVSKTTADELIKTFPGVGKKTEVIHNGFELPNVDSSTEDQPSSDPYVLMLGAHRPRKNLRLALATVAGVRDRECRLRLVITGEVHPIFEAAMRGAADFTQALGTVPKEHVFELLAGARAMLFPSLYEGFGLPLLEAMAVRCPVIALDTPINREIAGEGAILVPDSEDDWIRATTQVLNDQSARSELKAKGTENLRRFDWSRTAARYLEVMNESSG